MDIGKVEGYLRQEKVPNMAPAAIPTANPIMKPIFTRSKQLGWVWPWPYGPTATGICRGDGQKAGHRLCRWSDHVLIQLVFLRPPTNTARHT